MIIAKKRKSLGKKFSRRVQVVYLLFYALGVLTAVLTEIKCRGSTCVISLISGGL